MNELLNHREWQIIIQALLDGEGYPKTDEIKGFLGFSGRDMRSLMERLIADHDCALTNIDKQMIVNCVDGAIHYVDTDIPSLYDISANELRVFKECLEARWNVRSTYRRV